MKGKLLCHAQTHPVLRRKSPQDESNDYLGWAGRYILGAATAFSMSLEDNAFISSSPIKASIVEIVKGVEAGLGNEILLSLSIRIKSTPSGELEKVFAYDPSVKKACSTTDRNEIEWPVNPIDLPCYGHHESMMLIDMPWMLKILIAMRQMH